MLAKRIIPTMLVRGATLVKGERFNGWRVVGHAAQAARIHARRGVDELCILDISATSEGRGPNLDLVRDLSTDCYIPITVGGGVRSLQDIDDLLRAGADKVCIRTAKDLIQSASDRFGRQAIVYSLDYAQSDGVVSSARWAESMGAGEILLQSMKRDGTMVGYDLDMIRQVSSALGIPVVASGGCSGYADMLEAIEVGADACAAGALFQFTDCTPRGAAMFLRDHVEVRV